MLLRVPEIRVDIEEVALLVPVEEERGDERVGGGIESGE